MLVWDCMFELITEALALSSHAIKIFSIIVVRQSVVPSYFNHSLRKSTVHWILFLVVYILLDFSWN